MILRKESFTTWLLQWVFIAFVVVASIGWAVRMARSQGDIPAVEVPKKNYDAHVAHLDTADGDYIVITFKDGTRILRCGMNSCVELPSLSEAELSAWHESGRFAKP